MSTEEPTIIGKECRFIWHIPADDSKGLPDLHLVKEAIRYSDGTTKPNLKFVKDFKRPVYFTLKSARNHEQKREFEHLDKLVKKDCTQSELRATVAQGLDQGWSSPHLKQLLTSPYVYGADVDSTTWLRYQYKKKYPITESRCSYATLDIETDVLHEDTKDEPIIITMAHKNNAFIGYTKKFVKGYSNPHDRIMASIRKHFAGEPDAEGKLPHGKLDLSKINFIIVEAEDAVDLVKKAFKQIHERQPDILAIFNMDFDFPKMMDVLTKYGVDHKDVFCDPSIPDNLKQFEYKQGPKKKVTASGKVKPINPAEQWHTVFVTASYYVLDAMCVYRHLRLGDQELSSYSLDSILSHVLEKTKLEIPEIAHLKGLEAHKAGQADYKFDYLAYGFYDSFSMIELEEKTKDMTGKLPNYSGYADFWNFKSQPRRIIDDFFFYLLEEESLVLGCLGSRAKKFGDEVMEDVAVDGSDDGDDGDEDDFDEDVDENDEASREAPKTDEFGPQDKTLGLRGWIITLDPSRSVYGLKLIQEDGTIQTYIRTHAYDSDAVSSYPSATEAANVCKSTTKRELICVGDIDNELFRKQNLNLVIGPVNSLEYCNNMFNAPNVDDVMAHFMAA